MKVAFFGDFTTQLHALRKMLTVMLIMVCIYPSDLAPTHRKNCAHNR